MTDVVQKAHPLLKKQICGIASWEQWLERWNAVSTAEELISLLHYGFNTDGNRYDIVSFYLSVADGHADWTRPDSVLRNGESVHGVANMRTSLPPYPWANAVSLRQLVSKKAAEMLAVRFFGKPYSTRSARARNTWFHSFGDLERDVELVKELFEYLDPKTGSNNIAYVGNEQHYGVALSSYLRHFINYAWWMPNVASDNGYLETEIVQLCYESRPRLINMILSLSWGDMLLELPYDSRTIPHLESVLSDKGPQRVLVNTLAARGNKLAQTLILLRNQETIEKR